ncbi:MAG: M6 family metalloprotease domain-containing protein, partial [Muribaculaceae bacterium]|nr:M6 family metalloprotease domain-containing protein [Muribaculaceae bacterium]
MFKRLFFFIICITFALLSSAIPAKPGLVKYEQPDGTFVSVRIIGDEYSHFYLTEDDYPLTEKNDTLFFAFSNHENQILASNYPAVNIHERTDECINYLNSLNKEGIIELIKEKHSKLLIKNIRRQAALNSGRFPDAKFPTFGKIKAIVLLVEFQDITFRSDYDPQDYFTRLLNESGFSELGASGSASDYFRENSTNLFQPEFDVVGPITLSKPETFYGYNGIDVIDKNAGLMIVDACKVIDSKIDFSIYDCDNDGYIDNIFVFYAGKGEASGGSPTTIWPHSSDVKYFTQEKIILDGKILGRYACSNEIMDNKPDGIGTFVHEFSHVLGLPDLYATEYTGAFTPGSWDLMDYGSYNNNSRTPPLLSTFERYALGWISPSSPVYGENIINAMSSGGEGKIVKINENEYFFLETRIKSGWDSYVPGEGLLVWHVN